MSATRGAEPAYPVPDDRDPVTGAGIREGSPGLSKRELFAGMAMQGLLANAGNRDQPYNIAIEAAQYADALLAELERTR